MLMINKCTIKKYLPTLFCIPGLVLLTACGFGVSQSEYDAVSERAAYLSEKNAALSKENINMCSQNIELGAENLALKMENQELKGTNTELEKEVFNLQKELSFYKSAYEAELNKNARAAAETETEAEIKEPEDDQYTADDQYLGEGTSDYYHESSRTEYITDFYGKNIGRFEYQPNGDILVSNFYGKPLGRYIKSIDKTVDFYGKTVASGCVPGILLAGEVND